MARIKNQQVEQVEQNIDKPEMEAVDGRTRLKLLIVLGKERGYLTYAEINDHLPDDVQDSEQIDGIIGMINFAHGEVYMIGAFVSVISFVLLGAAGVSWVPLEVLAVLLMAMFFNIKSVDGRSIR